MNTHIFSLRMCIVIFTLSLYACSDGNRNGSNGAASAADTATDSINGTFLSGESIFASDGGLISNRAFEIDYENNSITATTSYTANIPQEIAITFYNETGLPTRIEPRESAPDTASTVNFSYNNINQLVETSVSSTSGVVVITHNYDAMGRVTQTRLEDLDDPDFIYIAITDFTYGTDTLLQTKSISDTETHRETGEIFTDSDQFFYIYSDNNLLERIDIDINADGSIDQSNNLSYNSMGNLLEIAETINDELARTTVYEYSDTAEPVFNEILWLRRFFP